MRRRSKYGAVRTTVDGIEFMSKGEAGRYQELKLLRAAGKIKGSIELQPRFKIVVNGVPICTYVADFQYFSTEVGHDVVEDFKGMETAIFRLKAKLLRACYPLIDFRVVK